MKVKAKHWVKYGGQWHRAGEVFDIEPADAGQMKLYAEMTEPDKEPDEAPEPEHSGTEEPAKRGRKRKAEE